MPFCTSHTIVLEKPQALAFRPLYCKRWSCDTCAPRRKLQLIRDCKSGRPTAFLTLTVNPAYGLSPSHRAQMLVLSWRKLRKRLLDGNKKMKVPFIAVFETTKAGEPHLHLLLRTDWIDQRVISAHQEFEMGAPVVWIKKVANQKHAANYVSKYAGKNPKSFVGCKRYYRSKDWPLEKREPLVLKKSTDRYHLLARFVEDVEVYAKFHRLKVRKAKGWLWVFDRGDAIFRRYASGDK